MFREARENRNSANEVRNEAFKINVTAEAKTEEIRKEAKELIARGEVTAAEANKTANKKIHAIEEEAERKCKILRQRHNEHDILIGKIQAIIESHAKCLRRSQQVFEDHEDIIKNIIKYTGEKFEVFEETNNKLEKSNFSLDDKIDKKMENLEEKVSKLEKEIATFDNTLIKVKNKIQKSLAIFTAIPIFGLFCIYFWITMTMPNKIYQETHSHFDELSFKLDSLKKGIESKVAHLETDTYSELKLSKKAISSLDKNLEQRFDMFVTKFQKQLKMFEVQVDQFEENVGQFQNEVGSLRDDIGDKFAGFQSEMIEELTEASTRIDEFMLPKIWISKTSSGEGKGKNIEGSNLGLYKEDGKENNKPAYRQIDGNYKLIFSADNKWLLTSLDGTEGEEIYIQMNPKVPELATDRWKYPSHKVSIVHTVPCCKNLAVRHRELGPGTTYTLSDLILGGRGVWKSPQGEVIYYHSISHTWQVLIYSTL